MTKLSYKSIATVIYLALKDTHGAEHTTIMHRAVDVLYRKRLLSKASKILGELEKIINKEEGRVVAHIVSVKKLDSATKSSLGVSLQKRYGARDIVFKESVNESLLGGFRVEVQNEVIDVSTKHKIDTLQAYLTR